MRDGVVRINHFGSFKLKRVAARKGHNPRTGETITIPARAKVIFTPCKALREMIEPVHKKPIPIASTKTESSSTVAPQKARPKPKPTPVAQAVPTSEPALLKTDDRTSTAVEQIDDIEEALTETSHKRGRTEKLIYIGIAATIIAMVAIKSMPRKSESPVQPLTASPTSEISVVEPVVITELELKPEEATMSTSETPSPVEDKVEQQPLEAPVAEESESELAQIIASQSSQQRIELEASTAPAISSQIVNEEEAELSQTVTEKQQISDEEPAPEITAQSPATTVDSPEPVSDVVVEKHQPVEEVVAETIVETPVSTVTEAISGKPMPVEDVLFFTERPYKLQAGNSLWRLSARFYKEPLYWPHIFYTNADSITNPDKLREGRTITMPTLEGGPGNLTGKDRDGIAEGYFLVYKFYKNSGHADAFFALLEAKRYSADVVERKRHTLTLSKIENIMLDQQKVVANL